MPNKIKWEFRQILNAAPSKQTFSFKSLDISKAGIRRNQISGYLAAMKATGLIERVGDCHGGGGSRVAVWQLTELGERVKRETLYISRRDR